MKLMGFNIGRQRAVAQETSADDLLREAATFFAAKEYEAAIAMWLPLAQAGQPAAQCGIGICLTGGLGAEADLVAGTK